MHELQFNGQMVRGILEGFRHGQSELLIASFNEQIQLGRIIALEFDMGRLVYLAGRTIIKQPDIFNLGVLKDEAVKRG